MSEVAAELCAFEGKHFEESKVCDRNECFYDFFEIQISNNNVWVSKFNENNLTSLNFVCRWSH